MVFLLCCWLIVVLLILVTWVKIFIALIILTVVPDCLSMCLDWTLPIARNSVYVYPCTLGKNHTHILWLAWKMWVRVMISVGLGMASQLSVRGKNFNIAIFLDAVNVINVKLCMIVLLFELYLFISLSVSLSIFQSCCSVRQFLLKFLCSYLIKSKLCMIVYFVI